MKKKYEIPEVECINLEDEEIITASGGCIGGDEGECTGEDM